MTRHRKYEVTFWPDRKLTVSARSEEEAVMVAIHESGHWPGSGEAQAEGWEFKVWVKEARG